eukprot:6193642-Pleurochrysis_carterae.AAC.3
MRDHAIHTHMRAASYPAIRHACSRHRIRRRRSEQAQVAIRLRQERRSRMWVGFKVLVAVWAALNTFDEIALVIKLARLGTALLPFSSGADQAHTLCELCDAVIADQLVKGARAITHWASMILYMHHTFAAMLG